MDIQALKGDDKALFDEIMCIADTKMVLAGWFMITITNGRAVGDWTAISGMIQDHYGHARALFGTLARFGLTRDHAEWSRSASEIRATEILDAPPTSWADLIASALLVEQAMVALLEAYQGNERDPELAALCGKIIKESRFHLSYLNGWMKVLVTNQPDVVQEAASRRADKMLRWWGPVGREDALFDAQLRTRWRDEIRRLFVAAAESSIPGLSLTASDISADAWDAATMRMSAPGIPDSLFQIIRFKNIELAMP